MFVAAHPYLRLGQAIVIKADLADSWPEMFHLKDPGKAVALLFKGIDTPTKTLEGSLDFLLKGN